ncbi:MAG: hypothetical protein ACLGHP_04790 [Vicinamibacteria bacterium]
MTATPQPLTHKDVSRWSISPKLRARIAATIDALAAAAAERDLAQAQADDFAAQRDRACAALAQMRSALTAAVEAVDATGTGHSEDCAQEQDNVVVAHDAGRPLSDCSCWVGNARAALSSPPDEWLAKKLEAAVRATWLEAARIVEEENPVPHSPPDGCVLCCDALGRRQHAAQFREQAAAKIVVLAARGGQR